MSSADVGMKPPALLRLMSRLLGFSYGCVIYQHNGEARLWWVATRGKRLWKVWPG